MTRRQLAVPLVAAALGSAVTAAALTAAGTTTTSTGARQQGLLSSSGGGQRLSVKEIFERSEASVVAIRVRPVEAVASPFDSAQAAGPAGEAVPQGPADEISTGSGFVLDDDGHILTSARVVSGVTDVQVTFSDLRTLPARVVGKDEETDLALLQVDPDGVDLRPLELGDSGELEPGDQAVMIANPSGLGLTAGTGTIAAEGEEVESPNGLVLRDVLETDAYIEPGAPGAPLLGADGRVIGISSGAASGPGGLGVAMPVNTARSVFAELEESHKVIRPYIGLRGRTITAAHQALAGGEAEGGSGVLVEEVYPGGPAEVAGLQDAESGGGDVIEAIDGQPVASLAELLNEVSSRQPGDTVTLTVLRDGSRGEVTVRLTERPASLPAG